jgi:hypothetical protein
MASVGARAKRCLYNIDHQFRRVRRSTPRSAVLQIGSLQTTANKTLNVSNPGQAGAWRLVTLQASREPDSGSCRRRIKCHDKERKNWFQGRHDCIKGIAEAGFLDEYGNQDARGVRAYTASRSQEATEEVSRATPITAAVRTVVTARRWSRKCHRRRPSYGGGGDRSRGCHSGGFTVFGWSLSITLNNELWTSIWPLYSMNPKSRNLFMKWLTRDRVVPIISASVS